MGSLQVLAIQLQDEHTASVQREEGSSASERLSDRIRIELECGLQSGLSATTAKGVPSLREQETRSIRDTEEASSLI